MKTENLNNYIGFYTVAFREVGSSHNFFESYILNPNKKNLSPADRFGNFAIFSIEMLQDVDKAEQFFLKALKRDPNNSFWLGNYAVFLHYYKKDFHKAALYYEKSLKINSSDPFLLFNYAYLNINILKNYSKAEDLLQKAIAKDKNNPDLYGIYAYFLYKILRRYKEAEKYILKAIDLDDTNPLWYVLLAQLLILKDDKVAAKDIIFRAFRFAKDDKSVQLELWFLLYAHYFPEYLDEAKFNILKCLEQGATLGDIDLNLNLVLAIENQHPRIDELKFLIRKMSQTISKKTSTSK